MGPLGSSSSSRSSSESEASETESEYAARESSSSRLAELIYDVCPNSRPLLDDFHPLRCEFEVGSASRRSLLLGLASDCTPGLGR